MAIVNLVATSVPELDKSQITVVDQKGNLLSDQLQELRADHGRQAVRLQPPHGKHAHPARAQHPAAGAGQRSLQGRSVADVDFSAVESTSEQFNPTSRRCAASSRSTNNAPQQWPARCAGRPEQPAAGAGLGAANHRWRAPPPCHQPGQPLVDANGQQIMDPATGQPMLAPYPADKRQQSTKNFELDRSISHTRSSRVA
jgi:flagellar M-ring protein FliF